MKWPSRSAFNLTSNFAMAVGSEAVSPILRMAARLHAGGPTPCKSWKRLLVVSDSHVGDLLYRSASLPVLKEHLPECRIHYLARPGASEVLEGNPGVDVVEACRRSDNVLDLEETDAVRLSRLKFDAIMCTGAVSGWRELVLGVKLGIPNRIGYAHRGFSGLVTHPVLPAHPRPYPEYIRDMVAQLLGAKPDWDVRPRVFPGEQDRQAADGLWRELGYEKDESVVACFVTTRQPGGAWPDQWFGEVAAKLQQRTGCRLVLCGTTGDRPLLESLRQRHSLKAEVNAGKLGLRALTHFLAQCRLTFSQDSGPRHMSNAARVPVVFARNLRVSALETGSYLDTEHDIVPAGVERVAPDQWKEVHAMVTVEHGVELAESLLRAGMRTSGLADR